jgi:hypothetical protein
MSRENHTLKETSGHYVSVASGLWMGSRDVVTATLVVLFLIFSPCGGYRVDAVCSLRGPHVGRLVPRMVALGVHWTLGAHQLMSGLRQYGIYSKWNIIQP